MIKLIYVSPSLRETSLFALNGFLVMSQYDNVQVGEAHALQDYTEVTAPTGGWFNEDMN